MIVLFFRIGTVCIQTVSTIGSEGMPYVFIRNLLLRDIGDEVTVLTFRKRKWSSGTWNDEATISD